MSKKHAIASNEKVLQRLRAPETDPYLARHGTQLQCKLCQTSHPSQSAYVLHTQGKRHTQELEARARLDTVQKPRPKAGISAIAPRSYPKIGRPKYTLTKVRAGDGRLGLLLNCKFPQISPSVEPQFRFMSAYEQSVEPKDSGASYLVVAAEPYNIVAIKFAAKRVSDSAADTWSFWDRDSREFYLQFLVS